MLSRAGDRFASLGAGLESRTFRAEVVPSRDGRSDSRYRNVEDLLAERGIDPADPVQCLNPSLFEKGSVAATTWSGSETGV